MTVYSPASARSSPDSSSVSSIAERKPTRPKLTPITGTPAPRKRLSARSIVPSPPRTTARSGVSSTSSMPRSRASCSTRSSASPTSARPCATTATRLTDGIRDPVVERGRKRRTRAVDEMEEELTVPLRAGEAGVGDADGLAVPLERRFGKRPDHPPMDRGVSHDAALHLLPARLELRLHEDDGLPARLREAENGRKGLAHADERDVARDQVRCERELPQIPGVDALHHRHAWIGPNPLVQLRPADVERDHPPRAALQQYVGEPARRRTDVDRVARRRVDAEGIEPVRELLPAARNEPRRLEHLDRRRLVDLLPGLVEAGHAPGHDQRLRLRPRLGETPLDQEDVQPLPHGRRAVSSSTSSARIEVSASIWASATRARSSVSAASASVASAPRSRTRPSASRRSSTTW